MNAGSGEAAAAAGSPGRGAAGAPSTMASRRLESLRRLNESAAAAPPPSLRLSLPASLPENQKQRLEERLRMLQLRDTTTGGGRVPGRRPVLVPGAAAAARREALDASEGSARSDGVSMNGHLPRGASSISPGIAVGRQMPLEDDSYRSVGAAVGRRTGGQSVRSFASEEPDDYSDSNRPAQDSGTTLNRGSSHRDINSTSDFNSSSQHSGQSSQRSGPNEAQPRSMGPNNSSRIDVEPESDDYLPEEEGSLEPSVPMQSAQDREPSVSSVRMEALRNPQIIHAIDRKRAMQQLVQQRILKQQQLALQEQQQLELRQQLQRQRQQQMQFNGRPLSMEAQAETARSARDLLIQRRMQQQRELTVSSQRVTPLAQHLPQEPSERQVMASQRGPPGHQPAAGNRLTPQQQQLLLLQREMKLRRDLARNQSQLQGLSNHSPLTGGRPQVGRTVSGPRTYPPSLRPQVSSNSLHSSQSLSLHGLGRDAPSPRLDSDFPYRHRPQDYQEYDYDRYPPPYRQEYYAQASSVYDADEPMYRNDWRGGNPGRAPARLPSMRSVSSSGPVVPPPPPPDKMIEVSPNFWVRLRGADETWAAVEHDYYEPVTCFGCTLELCCIKDADFVLCPTCRVVSPMNGIGGGPRLNGRDGGVGLGFTYESLMRWQSEILMARQQRSAYGEGSVYAS